MKIVKYRKYTGEPADAVDIDELMKRLGDFLLQSGFESQYYGLSEFDAAQSMEALRDAILRALQEGELIPEDLLSDELREMMQPAKDFVIPVGDHDGAQGQAHDEKSKGLQTFEIAHAVLHKLRNQLNSSAPAEGGGLGVMSSAMFCKVRQAPGSPKGRLTFCKIPLVWLPGLG